LLPEFNDLLKRTTTVKPKTMKIENIDKFLQEIGRVPLLTKEEELALLKAVQEKGHDCDEMEQLCQSNMRFVVALAAQYQNRGLKLEELISIGVEGLKKAALSYNLDGNVKFLHYAVSVMRQCLEEAVKEQIHKLVEQIAELQKKRYRFWMQDFENEDTGEIVSVERRELLVAEPAAEEKEILKQICDGAKEANTEDLNAFWHETSGFSDDDLLPVLQELSDRGDVPATDALNNIDRLWDMVQKGDKDATFYLAYRYASGDEEHGIFIDKKQAKELYDLAEWDDYNPNEESDGECEVVESDYCLQGDHAELDKVEHDIRVLAEKFGVLDDGLGGMYVPFDILFKKLVGSFYYEGNITKMKRLTANNLLLHAESSMSEPLLYALKRYYPQIEVNCSVDGNGFGEDEGIGIDE
jgi:RNA polymerase sigma factor (sigma-70 family)